MLLTSGRVGLRPLEEKDAESMLRLRIGNRAFFQPFEPLHSEAFYTLDGQGELIRKSLKDWADGKGYGFGIWDSGWKTLIGRLALTEVSRGVFQNAHLGYFLDKAYNGQGYMTEAVSLALTFAFREAGLHRVQAAAMPGNQASIRVLEKNGFLRIGLSPRYLKINGIWEDHLLFAVTEETI